MFQLPLFSATRIRRPFQRDREPHGQYGIEAAKDVSLVARNKRSTQSKRTVHMHFVAQNENGQLRIVIVQVDGVLTETKVVDRYPEVFGSTIAEWIERDNTFMRTMDNWMYVCAATMTRKYIVASVTIVRTNAENLSVLLLRYVHQTMTTNADNSRCSP